MLPALAAAGWCGCARELREAASPAAHDAGAPGAESPAGDERAPAGAAAAPGTARAVVPPAAADEGGPPTALQVTPQVTVSLVVHSPLEVVAGYQCRLEFDPAVVRVARVEGSRGADGWFAAAPFTRPDAFADGRLPLVGQQPADDEPFGRVLVAHVTFEPVGAGRSALLIRKAKVLNPAGEAIAEARVAVYPAYVEVGPAPPAAQASARGFYRALPRAR